jgi:hypothetical protein
MHYEAGVRVVAVGGRPTTGPMQAPSGSRGARLYSTDTLDANINFTQVILSLESPPSPNVTFLPNRTQALDVYVTYASINLRDQVRNTSTIPIQFAYEAADCRIFYTPQTIYNYTALWQYAADAIWSKPSLCVSGSTGFATTGTNRTDFTGPPASVSSSATNLTTYLKSLNTSSLPCLTKLNDGILDGGLRISNFNTGKPCTTTADCNPGSACAPVTTCLTSGKQGVQKQCVSRRVAVAIRAVAREQSVNCSSLFVRLVMAGSAWCSSVRLSRWVVRGCRRECVRRHRGRRSVGWC